MTSTFRGVLRPLALGTLLALGVPIAFADSSTGWRIELEGRSRVAGEVVLAFLPQGGKAENVTISLPAATNPEAAAVMIRTQLTRALAPDVYQVRVDDIDEVVVEGSGGHPAFAVSVVRNTTDGLQLDVDKD